MHEHGVTLKVSTKGAVLDAPNLMFEGINAYEGHLVLNPDLKEREDGVKKVLARVSGFKKYLEDNGIPVKDFTGAGTGTYNLTGSGDEYLPMCTAL